MKSKPPKPSDLKTFESYVLLAKQLVAEGTLLWTVSTAGFVRARLDDSGVADRKIMPEFRRILNEEITKIIDTIAHGWREDIWYHYLILEKENASVEPIKLTEEELKGIRKRVSLVREHLFIGSIKERFLLRMTSKGHSLEDIHWETCIKKQDQQKGDVDVPFVTLEFILSGPPSEDYYYSDGHTHVVAPRSTKRITVNCHVDEIDAIIDQLKLAQQKLRQLYPSSPGADYGATP